MAVVAWSRGTEFFDCVGGMSMGCGVFVNGDDESVTIVWESAGLLIGGQLFLFSIFFGLRGELGFLPSGSDGAD